MEVSWGIPTQVIDTVLAETALEVYMSNRITSGWAWCENRSWLVRVARLPGSSCLHINMYNSVQMFLFSFPLSFTYPG